VLEKEQLVLTDELKQILIGILLGDGYCQKQGVNTPESTIRRT